MIRKALAIICLISALYAVVGMCTVEETIIVGAETSTGEGTYELTEYKPEPEMKMKAVIVEFIFQKTGQFRNELADIIIDESTAAGYDPLLTTAIIYKESTFNTRCVGRAGERGLMQVHPCHRQFTRSRLFEAQYNIKSGLQVLRAHHQSAGSLRGGLRGYTGGRSGRYDSTYRHLKAEYNKL